MTEKRKRRKKEKEKKTVMRSTINQLLHRSCKCIIINLALDAQNVRVTQAGLESCHVGYANTPERTLQHFTALPSVSSGMILQAVTEPTLRAGVKLSCRKREQSSDPAGIF